MVIFIALLIAFKTFAVDVYVDLFHGLQNQLIFSVEAPVDIQESMLAGINVINDSKEGVRVNMQLWELSYRRYINNTSGGVFYSFGSRAGLTRISSSGFNEEKELAVMPFYDIGIKSKLNDRWYHVLKIEAGYFILYSDKINVDHMLGLQFTPFFSFGYNLD